MTSTEYFSSSVDDEGSLFVSNREIKILCVDDNEDVAAALRIKFAHVGGYDWRGWLPDAERLVEEVVRNEPDIVLLDVDMPGRDPFAVLEELSLQEIDVRTIIFSGHVRKELVDRALEAGAWGYVSKNDGEDSLLKAIGQVLSGEFAFSDEARCVCDQS